MNKSALNCALFVKTFCNAVPRPLRLWTTFPNRNHSTLASLFKSIRGAAIENAQRAPRVVFVGAGTFDEHGEHIDISLHACCQGALVKFALDIIGAGCTTTCILGGLFLHGKPDDMVSIRDLTLHGANGAGVFVDDVSFTLNNVHVTSADGSGVVASHFAKGRLINVEVSNCADSGVCVQDDGAVTFTGGRTSIHHNGRRRNLPWKRGDYGMKKRGQKYGYRARRCQVKVTRTSVAIRRFVSKFGKRTLPTLPTSMACFDTNLLARRIHELVFLDIDTS